MSVSFPPNAKVDLTIEFKKTDNEVLPIEISITEAVIYGLAVKYLGTTSFEGDRFEISLQNAQNSSNILTMNTALRDTHRFDVDVQDGTINIVARSVGGYSAVCFTPPNSEVLEEEPSNEVRFPVPIEIKNHVRTARSESFSRSQLKRIFAGMNVVVVYCSNGISRQTFFVAKKTDCDFYECDAFPLDPQSRAVWHVRLPSESRGNHLKFIEGGALWDGEPLYEQNLD